MSNSSADRCSPLGLFPAQPASRLYDCVVEALRSRHYSPPHGGGLPPLDSPIPPVSQRRSSAPTRRTGPEPVPDTSGSWRKRGCVHAEPGVGGGSFPLPAYSGTVPGPSRRVVRARKPKRLPVVLPCDEAQAILTELDGVRRLVDCCPPGPPLATSPYAAQDRSYPGQPKQGLDRPSPSRNNDDTGVGRTPCRESRGQGRPNPPR
jgi:hypothetical protein